ncbi:WD repeat-containing protein 89-like [Elysia marginata]|uniref:WD repeat-containing protein 89 n=1 Tax=Elysia marginata TaxID=1093978 RepID=A0AAV4GFM2_9GAST|nr:WD repeat-containing protein 89-like [Elysia marginata]
MDTVPQLLKDLENLSLTHKSFVNVGTGTTEGDYVVDISVQASSDTDPLIAAASSNFSICLMSLETLKPINTIKGHTDTITKVKFCKSNRHLFYSSSKDKSLRCWDSRISKQVQSFEIPSSVRADLLSMDISESGRLLCAGTESVKQESYLLFWDSRQPTVLGCYSECHQDDITQLSFQPGSDKILASGSSEGLVCSFDLSETCEDDALQMTFNAESDVVRMSWCGAGDECIYAVTTDNMFYVWDNEEGDSLSSIKSLGDLQGSTKNTRVDYIVDCIPSLTATADDRSSAVVLAGTYSGEASLLWHQEESKSKTVCSLSGGHTAPLRCSHWDAQTRMLLTGAEDSMVCLWSLKESESPPAILKTKTQGKAKSRPSVSRSGKKPYDKPKR